MKVSKIPVRSWESIQVQSQQMYHPLSICNFYSPVIYFYIA
jgi:hypothetical protein